MSERTRWLLVGIAGAVLILAVGWLLLIRPASDDLQQTRAAVEEQYAENDRTVAELETAKREAAEVPAKMAEIEQVQEKLPPTMEQSELVRSVQNAATAAGVDLTRISAQTPAAVEGSPGETELVSLPYDLTARGTYDALKTFVSGLEKLPRAFLLTDLYVGEQGEQVGELTLTLTGDFYSLGNYEVAPPQNLPTAAAGAGKRPKHEGAAGDAAKQRRGGR